MIHRNILRYKGARGNKETDEGGGDKEEEDEVVSTMSHPGMN